MELPSSIIGMCSFYSRYYPWFETGIKPLRRLQRLFHHAELPIMAWSPSTISFFKLIVKQILFHLPYFFVTIAPNLSSLRLIGPLMVWNTYSCNLITVPNPFGHLQFLRSPATALLIYLWRDHVYIQYYSNDVLIYPMKWMFALLWGRLLAVV